jgi:hypothetical protein
VWFLSAAAGFLKISPSAMARTKVISSTMPKPLTYPRKLPKAIFSSESRIYADDADFQVESLTANHQLLFNDTLTA